MMQPTDESPHRRRRVVPLRRFVQDITEDLPRPLAWALLGAVTCGALGGVVGLVMGLFANPATAWFAVFELGVPAALLGSVLGLVTGTASSLLRRSQRHGAQLITEPAPTRAGGPWRNDRTR